MATSLQRAAEGRKLIEQSLREAVSQAKRPVDRRTLANEPLVCVLVSGRDKYEEGDYPQFAVRIVNRSTEPVHLITAHTGTFPSSHFIITDAAGNTVPDERGHTDQLESIRKLTAASFIRVGPGDTFNPLGPDFSTADPWFIAKQRSGDYTVQFAYSTLNRRLRDYEWLVEGGKDPPVEPAIQRLFDQVPAVKLKSNEVRVTLPAVARQ